MAVSKKFLEYVLDQLSKWDGVSARKMFGGAGLYHDGKMFGLIADDMVYLKVDETNKEKYITAGSSPFQPFPDKAAMTSYYEVPVDVLENSTELIDWAAESLHIQKTQK